MYCSKCGTQNKEGSKFCRSCGTSLQKNKPINQERKQIKQNKVNQKVVNNSTQRLGSSNDFYTYLTAILIIVSMFSRLIANEVAVIMFIISFVFWIIGLTKTSNRILHFSLLILLIVVFLGTIIFSN